MATRFYFVVPSLNASVRGDVSWHIELCCQDIHRSVVGTSETYFDIYAAGALVTVRNIGNVPIAVRTDYL